MNEEMLKKAKSAQSAEELKSLAQGEGLTLTDEQCKQLFANIHSSGELADEELDSVAGGGCGAPKNDSMPRLNKKRSEMGDLSNIECPTCHAKPATLQNFCPGGGPFDPNGVYVLFTCPQCGQEFQIVYSG